MSAPPLFRLVDERRVSMVRDAGAVHRVIDADPVGACMVASRVADHGIDPTAIGGELWTRRHADESLCYAGANLIPLRGQSADLSAFADKAMSSARRCSSVVGRAELVLPLWERLHTAWGPARDVRDNQPLLALSGRPVCAVDPEVRRVRIDELDAYLVAAVDMFIGEVGIDPRVGDGGRGYRRRVAGLIAAGGPGSSTVRWSSRPRWVRNPRRWVRSRVSGCIRSAGAAVWARRALRRWQRRWWPAAGSPACM